MSNGGRLLPRLGRRFSRFQTSDLGPLVLSAIVLFVCLYYAYLDATSVNIRANIDPQTWQVIAVHQECKGPEAVDDPTCLRRGDRILQIDNLTFDDYRTKRWLPLWGEGRHDFVCMQVIRDDEPVTVLISNFPKPKLGLRKYIVWVFPLVFWFAGAAASVFLRPRDERWLILVLLYYDVALWGSSGFMSTNRAGYACIVFRVFVWLFLPLMVHLHLILPSRRFGWLRPALQGISYATAIGFIVYDHFVAPIPSAVLVVYTLVAVLLAMFLLVARFFIADSLSNQLVARVTTFGFVLGILPLLILVFVMLLDREETGQIYVTLVGILFLSIIMLWPFSYLYALYKHAHGRAEFRANRILAYYGFFTVVLTLFVALFLTIGQRFEDEPRSLMVFGLVMTLVFGVLAPLSLRQFRILVDRAIYRIRYQPDEVVSLFAKRIPSAFDQAKLKSVITDEILPTLMVRQSALYVFEDDGETLATVYEQAIHSGTPSYAELDGLQRRAKAFSNLDLAGDRRFDWVVVMVPLVAHHDQLVGVWLLGRRDPDDFYPRADIELLHNLGNQIAPVIDNVRLLEKARFEVAENKRLQEQLVQSQKMEAIGRLSAGVAHDFNNLLSVILGYSSLLITKYRDEETLAKYLNDIKDAGNRAAQLTKQLLAFSRQQVMEARVMDLNGVVSDVEKMLRRLTGEDIELVTDFEAGLAPVKIDPAQMSQVLMNLVVNARDAMPDGGRIRITTRRIFLPDGLEDSQGRIPPGDFACLTVVDTGTGVAPEALPRIFEPYFTTKELGKGTGLGLSMVYGIINQSRGHIRVDSRIGDGTTFRIYLPVRTDASTEVPPIGRVRSEATTGSETILLVEDEDSVRTVACEILESRGYRVLQAANGFRALESLEAHGGRVDLLLTDVIMPRMKGTELAQRLADLRPDVKVLYMSGYNQETVLDQRLGSEGSLLIQKPFDPEDLARRVREVLDSRMPAV